MESSRVSDRSNPISQQPLLIKIANINDFLSQTEFYPQKLGFSHLNPSQIRQASCLSFSIAFCFFRDATLSFFNKTPLHFFI